MLRHHDRTPCSVIAERKDFSWPEGRRLAVYLAINIEQFSWNEGEGGQLVPGEPPPNTRTFTWRDYGNRAGFWHLLTLLDEMGWPLTANLNSEIYNFYPQIPAALRQRGAEFVGHGRTNGERQARFREDDERRLIDETTETIAQHEGRRPRGWLSPYFSESIVTPDLIKEAGYAYSLNWHFDDQPVWLDTRSGPLLNIPYPPETNDSSVIQHRMGSGADFADQIIDEFDEMLRLSKHYPLVCPIALHTFLVGRPFRLRHLRRAFEHINRHRDQVWLVQAGDIADFALGLDPGILAGSSGAR